MQHPVRSRRTKRPSFTSGRAGLSLAAALLSFFLCATAAAAAAAPTVPHAADTARTTLASADATLQRCVAALDALPKTPEVEAALGDLHRQLRGQRGTPFDAEAALARVTQAAGAPVPITAGQLALCAGAYRTQAELGEAPDIAARTGGTGSGYPNCAGACPQPSSPGGICCGSSLCSQTCGARGNCAAICESICFPSDATVRLADGSVRTMENLRLGDRVQVVRDDGSVGYEDVYLMTHDDPSIAADYLDVALSGGGRLRLSPRHFVPVAQGGDAHWRERVIVGADELKAGDTIWHRAGDGTMATATVASVHRFRTLGAFNPMTRSGTIVVDGVVASAHSDWFLDGLASADAQAAIYQRMLAPARLLYAVIGPALMQRITQQWGVTRFMRTHPFIGIPLLLVAFGLLAGIAFRLLRLTWRTLAMRIDTLHEAPIDLPAHFRTGS